MGVSKGILSIVGSSAVDTPISYISEIEKFAEERLEIPFAFLNLERQSRAAISHLAYRSLPILFALGDVSSGFATDLVNGIQNPGEDDLLQQISQKISDHGNIAYLFLPNLCVPGKTYGISYADGDLEKDILAAHHFSADIAGLLNSYVPENREKINLEFKENAFRKYVFDIINSVYSVIYSQMDGSTISSARISPDYKLVFPEGAEQSGITERLKKRMQRKISSFRKNIERCDVIGKSSEQVHEIVVEELDRYDKEILSDFEKPEHGLSQKEISEELSKAVRRGKITGISMESLNDIVERLNLIRQSYSEEKCSPLLKDWMDNVIAYFMGSKGELERAVISFLDGAEKEEGCSFSIRHGNYTIPIEKIMQINVKRPQVNSLYNDIDEFYIESLFGTFLEPSEEVPPHMILSSVGLFFQGSAVLLKNNASAFMNTMLKKKEDEKEPFIEKFLSSMRKELFTISYKGISFEFKAPSVVIGSDSVTPFEHAGDLQQKLEERIKIIELPPYVENTAKSRLGTLSVIYNTIDDFNRRQKKDITFSSDAVDCLLRQEISVFPSISIKYGRLIEKLTNIMIFAAQHRCKEVSLETFRKYRLETDPENLMELIDKDIINEGGCEKIIEGTSNIVNGLVIWARDKIASGEVDRGMRFPVSSYNNSNPQSKMRKEKFVFYDAKYKLSSKDANKGYQLALDYIAKHIETDAIKGQISTEMYGNSDEFEGNSASLAIALSILSAISGTEIYRNRFFTGTLQPEDGTIGRIGGIVEKATVPSRIYEKTNEKKPLYFIFPSGNTRELADGLLDDPYGIADNVTCIPASKFEIAWYLATCGPKIEQEHLVDLEKKASEYFAATIDSIGQKK